MSMGSYSSPSKGGSSNGVGASSSGGGGGGIGAGGGSPYAKGLTSRDLSAASFERRISALEGRLEQVHLQVDKAGADVRDSQRHHHALSTVVAKQGAVLEGVTQESEARQGLAGRMDSWARQGEQWREEVRVGGMGVGLWW